MADQLIVRLDPKLHEALRLWAKREQRSIAAQVRVVLAGAVPQEFLEQAAYEGGDECER